jgi:hypothetical protein
MAEREGFEPSIRINVYRLSKRAPSATRPPLLIIDLIGFEQTCYTLYSALKPSAQGKQNHGFAQLLLCLLVSFILAGIASA